MIHFLKLQDGGAAKKTVLVFIHGGGFAGSDTYLGPDFLITQDNIVVNIAYRLGIYGFLNLDHGEITGNMALKDQQLGMKWVYENIAHFGGKPDEILLFGQSKGGSSVHFQQMNEQSRKYYKRAFAMSGSVLYAIPPNLIVQNNVDLLKNCTEIQDMDKLIEYIETAPVSDISKCSKMGSAIWAPTIECLNAPKPFLTKQPEEILNSDQKPIMDTMFSFNSEEAIQFDPDMVNQTEPFINKDWRKTAIDMPFEGFTKKHYPKVILIVALSMLLDFLILFNAFFQEYAQASNLLWKAYYQNATTPEQIKRQNVAFNSDISLRVSILRSAMLQANANGPKNNTFLYR